MFYEWTLVSPLASVGCTADWCGLCGKRLPRVRGILFVVSLAAASWVLMACGWPMRVAKRLVAHWAFPLASKIAPPAKFRRARLIRSCRAFPFAGAGGASGGARLAFDAGTACLYGARQS